MNGKILLSLLPLIAAAEVKVSDGFLDNGLIDMAVHGSRVAVSSESGISWVDDLRIQPLQWKSITGIEPFSDEEQFYRDDILLSDSEMVAIVKSSTFGITYLYRNFSAQTNSVKTFVPTGITPNGAEFHGYKGTEHAGKFYIPAYDAGIVQIESGEPTGILIPDSNKVFPTDYSFTATLPDSLKPIALSSDDTTLTVLTESLLMKFRFADSTWSKRTLPVGPNWYGITETPSGLVLTGNDTTTNETVHIATDSKFTKIFSGATGAVRFGKSTFYALSSTTGIEPYSESTGKIDESINQFGARIENSAGFGGSYEIRDIGYSVAGTDTIFAIATSAGFLYSTNEHADEVAKTPFNYVRRDRQLKAGLDETYAVPFIIRENAPAVFEYTLAEDANVTIDILDYNLDFVCRIVDGEFRKVNSASGQSTNRSRDKWDGSRSGGGSVASGVYYYKITTDRGERGFGKVIVAKN